MKNIAILASAGFLLIALEGWAQLPETLLKTTPTSITIHLKGAELIQTSSLNLKAGRQRVIFTGLSPKLNPQSVQVTATNGVQLLSVTTKTNFFRESEASPAAKLLQDSINVLATQRQALSDDKAAYEKERDLLTQNQVLTGKEQALTVEQLAKAADFYRSRFKELNATLTGLQRKITEMEVTQKRLMGQIGQSNEGRRPTSEVYVDIEVKASTSSEMKLRYVVDNAGWSPVYDLMSTNINEPVKLKYRALAFNDSGIDWNNVTLRLSTADPYQGAGQPQLQTWALRNMPQMADMGMLKGQYQGRAQLDINQQSQNYSFLHDLNPNIRYDGAGKAASGAPVSPEPQIAFETIEISELSTDFDIPTPYTIPADSKPYSIEIMEQQLEATYKHLAVPKLDKDAFLLAQVTGWEKLDLIAGPVNVYRKENFIGMAQLNPHILSDTLELSLGRDANVLVKREKVKEYSRKQFLGGNKFSSFSWKISVKNNHKQPISIELQDQVPISEVKEISVEVKEISGARRIENTGKLVWDLTLQPGEVKTVSLNFTVKHPENMEVEMEQLRKAVSPRYF
ncbi:MAG: DUF4139 domain-containing protein [Saprospiraceae bacterium]|jgi:uncharacterized protein (TIGR02231 family)|nr:DUF4139 domain-containing protein [Saprospiraceae bacterium]